VDGELDEGVGLGDWILGFRVETTPRVYGGDSVDNEKNDLRVEFLGKCKLLIKFFVIPPESRHVLTRLDHDNADNVSISYCRD